MMFGFGLELGESNWGFGQFGLNMGLCGDM